MNNLNAIGRVGRDAEQKQTQGGATFINFSLAIDSGYGQNKQTTWMDCTVWGKSGESGLYQYIHKGDQLGISGEISLDTWTDREGKERQSLRCRVSDVTLISNKHEENAQQNGADGHSSNAASGQAPEGEDDWNQDIPF